MLEPLGSARDHRRSPFCVFSRRFYVWFGRCGLHLTEFGVFEYCTVIGENSDFSVRDARTAVLSPVSVSFYCSDR